MVNKYIVIGLENTILSIVMSPTNIGPGWGNINRCTSGEWCGGDKKMVHCTIETFWYKFY